MGLKSEKNYITSNAVDVILMPTKKRPNKEILYKEKKNYGKVPEYLSKIREDIEKEYKTIREMQIRNEEDELKKKKKLSKSVFTINSSFIININILTNLGFLVILSKA